MLGKKEKVSVRFCPECKSTDVGFVFRLQNIFGLMPRVECRKCGFQDVDFPLLVVGKDSLEKKGKKKAKKKTKKKVTRK
jgi:Zn ribbon nucleic-acid-binding protein